MFYVGQKVVCVVPKAGNHGPGAIEPGKGDVGTIINIYPDPDDGELILELAEWPAPMSVGAAPEDIWFPGWYATDFRPLVEHETDISLFLAMLNPSKVDA